MKAGFLGSNEEQHIIDITKAYIQEKFESEGSGHDWWHIYRVWKTSIKIANEENACQFIVQLAALLHDIADWKFTQGDDQIGSQMAKEWLESLEVNPLQIEHVCQIISDMSFKGANVNTQMNTIEGMIVQDADRLDAIGAIGIGRTFTYGGYKGRQMFDPTTPPKMHNSFSEYKENKSPTINHFYEKLLLLKDRMNTNTAKVIAEERHEFMQLFLKRFNEEWEGQA